MLAYTLTKGAIVAVGYITSLLGRPTRSVLATPI